MLNWPTAIAVIFVAIMAMISFDNWIDRNKPLAKNCASCRQKLRDEYRDAIGESEPDE